MKYILLLTSVSMILTGCLSGEGEPFEWRSRVEKSHSDSERGYNHFLFSDFYSLNGANLETGVIPWKLATAALLFEKKVDPIHSRMQLRKMFEKNGFLFPDEIKNAPKGYVDSFNDSPVGLVRGMIDLRVNHTPFSRVVLPNVEGAVFGCATCHSGVSYDQNGHPLKNEVWLGLPNTSLNVDGFVGDVSRALAKAASVENRSAFKKYIRRLYPDSREARHLLFLNSTLKEIQARLQDSAPLGILPFHSGGAGNTNGVAAIKNTFKLSDKNMLAQEQGYTSIPVIFDRQFRSSFLYDGVYMPESRNERFWEVRKGGDQLGLGEIARIVSFFTIPSMGNTEERAAATFEESTDILKFIIQAKRPKWPAEIDMELAFQGHKVFENSCASCHGHYRWPNDQVELFSFPNRLVALDEIGTDPKRANSISAALVNRASRGIISRYVRVKNTAGYVAPLLTSVSLTAPYLHNGSVPTLWQLMNPKERPSRFLVGGHSLDLKKVGVLESSSESKNFSKPVLVDTSAPGLGNLGHESPFDELNAEQKWEVIEFLKLL